MLSTDKNQDNLKKIQELEKFLADSKDIREWKRVKTVMLILLGITPNQIRQILDVSPTFITQCCQKYQNSGIAGLKLRYKGSKGYLTDEQKAEILVWLNAPERRNISELERYLIETYDVVFKSPESSYKILRDSQLSWQKANRENSKKNLNWWKKEIKNLQKFSMNIEKK